MEMNKIYFNLENNNSKKKNNKRIPLIIFLILSLSTIILNIVAWLSKGFCEWHTKYIFPIWLNTYGRFTSIFKFSLGEILLIIGVLLIIAWVILGIVAIIKKEKSFICTYSKIMAWIILFVCIIQTQNCAILYHNDTFLEKYLSENENREYTIEELSILRDYIVVKCNELSKQLERDENLDLIYSENINQKGILAISALGEQYPELKGYYVQPKFFTFSKFFSQQYIMGYYFPFSLEANYNKVMYIANFPSTVCHELSHTKGFMREYDANFISYLACINSDDVFFQYCGYLSILNYVDNDFFKAIGKNREEYFSHEIINELVIHDNIFLSEENWKKVEESAIIDTETVKEVSDTLMETSLVLNGVPEGMISYNEVVQLLLRYYDNNLY